MQVFESQREKDRGELSIDESEARLRRFALELAKRGWIHDPNAPPPTSSKKGRLVKLKLGSGPSSQGLSNQASAAAIEDFLRLNFALLDVKKFQRVNVEAARKILKKHDKRTALTASNDLRTFMAQQEAARRAMGINPVGTGGVINLPASAFQPAADASSASSTALVSSAAHPSLAALLPSATTGILSESLPHILLSLVTTTTPPDPPRRRRLQLCNLHVGSLATGQTRLLASLLPTLSGQAAASGQGRLSALPCAGRGQDGRPQEHG